MCFSRYCHFTAIIKYNFHHPDQLLNTQKAKFTRKSAMYSGSIAIIHMQKQGHRNEIWSAGEGGTTGYMANLAARAYNGGLGV